MSHLFILILRILILKHVMCEPVKRVPVVNTTLGAVRGVRANDGDYTMYLGIPYAQVNRSNPFGIPLPPRTFQNVFEANDDSRGCPENTNLRVLKTLSGSLDCLNLNVYVPDSVQNKRPLPVLVWIYGGTFVRGSAQSWKPKYLLKHNVILVTFNYRSGPYGFMCLGTPDVPGNQGLKDQALALRWIKDNIKAFSGDGDNMTLYGCSSGSVLVHYHILFNKDRFFKKYILQSGVATAYWAVKNKDESKPFTLARQLGFTTNSTTEALDFLAAQHELSVTKASCDLDLVYAPCVEQHFDGVEAFVTEHPVNVIQNYQNISILMGHTDDEGIYLLEKKLINTSSKYGLDEALRTALISSFEIDNNEMFEVEKSIMHYFYSDNETYTRRKTRIRDVVNAISDHFMCSPTELAMQSFVGSGAAVYRYLFTYVGERNYKKSCNNSTLGGATHADDVSYIFHIPVCLPDDPTPSDQHMINMMTTLFYNFAQYGDPTPTPTELLPVKWLPVTNDTLHYLRMDSPLSTGTRPFNRRMAFWDLLVMTNRKYIKGLRDSL